MPGAFLQNFKAILPSWKFFDRVGAIPVFSYRAVDGDWIEWRPKYERGLQTLFFNPQGNLILAKVSLLERVLSELSQSVEAEVYFDSVSYKLLQTWAREEILQIAPSTQIFQFRVSYRQQLDPSAAPVEALTSIEHEV